MLGALHGRWFSANDATWLLQWSKNEGVYTVVPTHAGIEPTAKVDVQPYD